MPTETRLRCRRRTPISVRIRPYADSGRLMVSVETRTVGKWGWREGGSARFKDVLVGAEVGASADVASVRAEAVWLGSDLGFHPGWAAALSGLPQWNSARSTSGRNCSGIWRQSMWKSRTRPPTVARPASESWWCRRSSRGSHCFRDTGW